MIPGVDRSHHNGYVPISSLVDKGIRFIFFKATQGVTYIDPAFNASWQEAKAIAELAIGCYAFFDGRYDGIEQAKHYLSLGVNFAADGCLPPCVDVEDLIGTDEADTERANKWVADNFKLVLQRLNDFLTYIKEHTGRDCIIYTYNNYIKEYFHSYGFPNNPMWLSSLQANCPVRYDTGKLPLFWQNTYHWNGSDMDGNVFMGTQEELNQLANITNQTT